MLISDFGLCKKLDVDQSSFLPTTYEAIAAGTTGWRAPEMLVCGDNKLDDTLATNNDTMSSLATTINSSESSDTSTTTCLTKSVDIFALGCLFYYILTKGGHPYGNCSDREANIINENKDLSLLYSNEEAHDLITHMLHRQPSQRPDIETCLLHPFFWDPAKRLGFLRDASDRFEVMCKDPMDRVLIRLEKDAKIIIKTDWHQTLDQSSDQILIKNLRQSRKYDGGSLRDLLRALRNKVNLSFKYYFLLNPFYINRITTTKTFPMTLNFNLDQCPKVSSHISRIGIQDYSFMCMKWSKTRICIASQCLQRILNCQNLELALQVPPGLFFPSLSLGLLAFDTPALALDTVLAHPPSCVPGFLLYSFYTLFL